MRRGYFISLEGPEGSGKTSQAVALVEYLRSQAYSVLATREPGGTPIGERIREVLSDLQNKEMQPRTELLLFQASRAQLVEQVILPHLRSGGIVVSDRYADSTLAYQGFGHKKFDLDQVRVLIEFATGGLKPDLTLLLDVDVKEGLHRKMNAGEWNRLDDYDVEFHQRVRQGYLQMLKAEPERWVIIDAGQPPERVQANLQKVVIERLQVVRASEVV